MFGRWNVSVSTLRDGVTDVRHPPARYQTATAVQPTDAIATDAGPLRGGGSGPAGPVERAVVTATAAAPRRASDAASTLQRERMPSAPGTRCAARSAARKATAQATTRAVPRRCPARRRTRIAAVQPAAPATAAKI